MPHNKAVLGNLEELYEQYVLKHPLSRENLLGTPKALTMSKVTVSNISYGWGAFF